MVLDLDMPESGFYVLLDLVRDRTRPPMAVVILTHLPYPYLFEMARDNGAQACLVKQATRVQDLDHAIQNAVAAVRSKDLSRAPSSRWYSLTNQP